MSMIPVDLTRKPGTTRCLVAQRVEGNGVLQDEVPKQEQPCLQRQLVDGHRTFCLWVTGLCREVQIERTSKRLCRLDAAHVERWTDRITYRVLTCPPDRQTTS